MWQPGHQIETRPRLSSEPLPAAADRFIGRSTRVVIPFPDHTESAGQNKWYQGIERNPVFFLRLSLALVFLWFGLLKLANVSPVIALLRSSFPLLATTPFIQLLGGAEVCISIGLVINRWSRHTVVLMILHLLATLSVAVLAPQLIFSPRFPVLTLAGEFLVKNLVLISGGIVIMFSRQAHTIRRIAFTE